jgi:hypothetical protein
VRERGGSMRDRIRRMVIDDPEITIDEILSSIKPKNDKRAELPSRFMVDSLRNDTRQTLRLLKDLGFLDAAYLRSVKL